MKIIYKSIQVLINSNREEWIGLVATNYGVNEQDVLRQLGIKS